ncbi:MAG: Rrf2 family transcriptional regulator [Bacteroidetes bacterium]|nr:Rrf2 family transcriptional regulator [Bacteroidota bacterium]MCW5896752.1 Rrf2 family transcriptional regulator [Bacteroidota bacterium]
MSLIFSRQCEYAIQSVLYLALKPRSQMTSIRELATELDIPYHFLAKILQDLSRKEFLVSQKGPSGGFALSVPPEDITLFHIVEAVDGIAFTTMCVLGFSECTPQCPCGVHDEWAELRDAVYRMLTRKNIASMALSTRKPGYLNRLKEHNETS